MFGIQSMRVLWLRNSFIQVSLFGIVQSKLF